MPRKHWHNFTVPKANKQMKSNPPKQNNPSTRKKLQDSVYKILIKEVVR